MSKNSTNNKKRDMIHEAKKNPCVDCGGKFPYYVMDLDHMPQHTKSFSLGKYIQHTLKEIEEEIAKCEAVCANCHRMRTHSRGYYNQIKFAK